MVTSDVLTGSRNIGVSRMHNEKVCNLTLIYGRITKIPASYRKLGSGNTTVMSDFRKKVEICPFRACAMKNMQFGPYLWPNRQNS